MSKPSQFLERVVRKLATRAPLDEADRQAVMALPFVERSYHATTYVVREGDAPRRHCDFISAGFAFRQKLTSNGGRQIVSIHMPGDFIDLQHLFLNIADHSVQALTPLEVVGIERQALRHIALERPAVGSALWIDALVDSSIYREWVMNIGRRDARARIAHILCEVSIRMRAAGILSEERFELPLTQEQLADAVGLTPVHVNRTLKSLVDDGVVYRDKRYISFTDWNAIATIGGFNPLYLHLDQAGSI
jgi:CRP-like cAMP-binding protein